MMVVLTTPSSQGGYILRSILLHHLLIVTLTIPEQCQWCSLAGLDAHGGSVSFNFASMPSDFWDILLVVIHSHSAIIARNILSKDHVLARSSKTDCVFRVREDRLQSTSPETHELCATGFRQV